MERGRLITTPCDDDLVKLYFGIVFSSKEILAILAQKHNVVICVRILKTSVQKVKAPMWRTRSPYANRNSWKWL